MIKWLGSSCCVLGEGNGKGERGVRAGCRRQMVEYEQGEAILRLAFAWGFTGRDGSVMIRCLGFPYQPGQKAQCSVKQPNT